MRQLCSVGGAAFVSAAAFVLACTGQTRPQAAAVPDPCVFTQAFDRADEQGKAKVHVYQGQPESVAGGVAPLVFVSDLKVNTDGTRISYKVDDPTAQHGAINDMRNAMRSGAKMADFTAIAATG